MQKIREFPLQGVIGIVANAMEEVDLAVANKLLCVEIRADLLLDSGLSTDDLMDTIKRSKSSGLAVLFTLRHPTHGGKFSGSEEQRASISRQALQAGADLIDLEWDTKAAQLLHDERSHLVLSYHDFNGMPGKFDLDTLTSRMCSDNPAAIKIVPTASTLQDAVRMLEWVAVPGDSNDVTRIGFAMGPPGTCSRVLTLAHGAPITYASFGKAVAPGQVEMDALLTFYRVNAMTADTTVVAIAGQSSVAEERAAVLNQQYGAQQVNQVAIAFPNVPVDELETHSQSLRISEIIS